MIEKTLVVLAAGMGSRFGGLKQIEPVGPNGEFLIDYSIYSALKYGFNKVVFIIKEENYEVFKNTIGSRLEDKVEIEYVFQKSEDLPGNYKIPEDRIKPLGTAHAIYAARNNLKGNFAIINSDDYYGDLGFKDLSEAMNSTYNHVVVGYKVGDTLSENGSVKRGIIFYDEDNRITSIVESSCVLDNGEVLCTPLDESIPPFRVPLDQPASMMLMGLNKAILLSIEKDMIEYFESGKDMSTYEFLIPDVLDKEIKNDIVVYLSKTNSKWKGVTYKSDLDSLKEHILKEIDEGIYPNNLWSNSKSM